MRNPNKIFICYSHKDQKWLRWLDPYLKPLVRDEAIEEWSDRKIDAGKKWKEEVRNALQTSGIALLIISQDFLASDFIYENELPPILEAEGNEGMRLLCLYVRPCDIASFPKLQEFQAVNNPQKPLAELSVPARDRIGVSIAENIRQYQTWSNAGTQEPNNQIAIDEVDDIEEKGFLEFKADSTEAMSELTGGLTRVAALTSQIGDKFKARQETLNSILSRGEDNPKLAVNLVNASALDLNDYADKLETEVQNLEATATIMHDNLVPWLKWRHENGHTADNSDFATSMHYLINAAGPSIEQMEKFRDSFSGMKGASKPMNRAVTRSKSILDRLIDSMKKIRTDGAEYLSFLE